MTFGLLMALSNNNILFFPRKIQQRQTTTTTDYPFTRWYFFLFLSFFIKVSSLLSPSPPIPPHSKLFFKLRRGGRGRWIGIRKKIFVELWPFNVFFFVYPFSFKIFANSWKKKFFFSLFLFLFLPRFSFCFCRRRRCLRRGGRIRKKKKRNKIDFKCF